VCCCSVMQCVHVAVCCSVSAGGGRFDEPRLMRQASRATHCNTLQHTATHYNTLQHTATHCNTLLHTAAHGSTRQYAITSSNTLQHAATSCNTLQHPVTYDRPRLYAAQEPFCQKGRFFSLSQSQKGPVYSQ